MPDTPFVILALGPNKKGTAELFLWKEDWFDCAFNLQDNNPARES
jgi:hypothetical protein